MQTGLSLQSAELTAKVYQIVDLRTRAVVGTFKSRTRARRKADKLDMEYGAYRYIVREAQ